MKIGKKKVFSKYTSTVLFYHLLLISVTFFGFYSLNRNFCLTLSIFPGISFASVWIFLKFIKVSIFSFILYFLSVYLAFLSCLFFPFFFSGLLFCVSQCLIFDNKKTSIFITKTAVF